MPGTSMHSRRSLALLGVFALAVAGCGASASTASNAAAGATATSRASASPAAADTLTVFYEENCQVELVAPSGKRVLIDVWNPAALSKPATAADVLLTTHLHNDHYNQAFADAFPGKTVTNKSGDFDFDGVKVKSVAASHYDDNVDQADPSNHIFSIDFAGFHIAHLGSTGQDVLTSDQLAAIGQPDIAFAVLIDLSNGTGDVNRPIKIVDQMKPKLLIPTHTKLETVQAAAGTWPGSYSTKPSVTIARDKLGATTQVLFMGQLAISYGSILHYAESSW